MRKQKLILIGPCGGGSIPKNGASAKNYHLLNHFHQMNIKVSLIDTEHWKRNPFVLVKLAIIIIFHPRSKYILSTNSMSCYRILRIMSHFPGRRSVIYWVIGGCVANWIKEGRVKVAPYKQVNYFLVEGRKMQRTFSEIGFENTIYVPNFKNINYLPALKLKQNEIVNFVFLSRIIPEKGCNTILEAVKLINNQYHDKFFVDFYGPIDDKYEENFKREVSEIKNVSYKGFIDLRNQRNYDLLAEYDVMLFPTYWQGEGFPGVVIDAFISGLPVIASDWNLNADIISDGQTGVILHNNSTADLANAMVDFIDNPAKIQFMSGFCRNSAMNYDVRNVVSDKLLKTIGIG